MYASQYSEIPAVLAGNQQLRDRVLQLLGQEPMPGKVTEGGSRLNDARALLGQVVRGETTPAAAYIEVERRIPRSSSPHSGNNRVFADGWGERFVRTHLSRFYNQAVLQLAMEAGLEEVFIPHSSEERGDSECTRLLAGSRQSSRVLLDRLNRSYGQGDFTAGDPKIPQHPHCTHVVRPDA